MMKELLIEKWFPVDVVNIESKRERGAQFPPLVQLHLWWARRPHTASRVVSILGALPSDAYKPEEYVKLLYAMGLRGDPIKAIEDSGNGKKAFSYPVFEAVNPIPEQYIEKAKALWGRFPIGADFMAGGGAIPFEMARSGYGLVVAGDLNPVSYVILKAGLEYPAIYGDRLVTDVDKYGKQILKELREKVKIYYPAHPEGQPRNYIWIKMFRCPECGCEIPALKQMMIDKINKIALYPELNNGKIKFKVVKVEEIGEKLKILNGEFQGVEYEARGYVDHGVLECPLHRHTVSREKVKLQYKNSVEINDKGYSNSPKATLAAIVLKQGTFREPTLEMIKGYEKAERDLGENWDDYIAEDLIPIEFISQGVNTEQPLSFGINKWYQFFNSRQLLAHAEIVKLIRRKHAQIIEDEKRKGISEKEAEKYATAVSVYLTLALGKILDYNSLFTSWHSGRGTIRNTFDSHALAPTWDYAEGDMLNEKTGYAWCIKNSLKALKGIVIRKAEPVNIIIGDAANVSSPLSERFFDIIITDPPYYGNVHYSEISDFFYVWFKRVLNYSFPYAFSSIDTPKINEAVANKVRYGNVKLSNVFYERKMNAIFVNMNKILNPEGAFILWFAHKSGIAWSSTINALLNSGFTITALWGVRAEMERSLHITGKASLKTNILMVCRKRTQPGGYIQDVLNNLESTLEPRLRELESYGIDGPDYIMGAQAEALKAASQRWPLKDPEGKLNSQEMLDLVIDQAVGYAVNHVTRRIAPQLAGADSPTKFYVLARYLYKDAMPYDDARRLALACLGTTGTGDPVKQIALDIDLGQLTTETVSGERAKVLTLTDPVERFRNGRLSTGNSAPIIDHIHRAIALLQEGKTPTQAAEALADAGPTALDALNALYQAIPEGNPERVHIQTLLITIGDEPIKPRRPTPTTRESKLTDFTEEKK